MPRIHPRSNLFKIFNNDLLFFINEIKLANFTDDNTIHAAKRELNELLRLLEKESEVAIKFLKVSNNYYKQAK